MLVIRMTVRQCTLSYARILTMLEPETYERLSLLKPSGNVKKLLKHAVKRLLASA
jgi:hypothetical protein